MDRAGFLTECTREAGQVFLTSVRGDAACGAEPGQRL